MRSGLWDHSSTHSAEWVNSDENCIWRQTTYPIYLVDDIFIPQEGVNVLKTQLQDVRLQKISNMKLHCDFT